MNIKANYDNIKIPGWRGTWYVIDYDYFPPLDCVIFLLEHETYGDETEHLIVDESGLVILDDVWNGFEGLEDAYII